VPRAFVSEGVDHDVRQAFDAALDSLRDAGATLWTWSFRTRSTRFRLLPGLHRRGELEPGAVRRREVRLSIAGVEDDTLKTMYSRTREEGFGPEVKRRIIWARTS